MTTGIGQPEMYHHCSDWECLVSCYGSFRDVGEGSVS